MGNCNKKEFNRDMIQDEIVAARDRPEVMNKMQKARKDSNNEDNDSENSDDSYGKIG